MKIQITKTIGKSQFTFWIEKENELKALATAGFIASMPTECGLCPKGSEVTLASHKATSEKGTFEFSYVKCLKCGAKAQVGEYKAGGYYWKEWEKYQSKEKEEIK